MKDITLFQLGYGLETGAKEEDTPPRALAPQSDPVVMRDVFDADREDHFIRRDGNVFAGTHLIIEVVNGSGLDDEARIQQAFRDCVDSCGGTLLHIHTHKFSPQGVSGEAVLAESHISVHTWPEIGYGAFDVFMCGAAKPWKAVDVLARAFGTADVRVKELLRGDGGMAREVLKHAKVEHVTMVEIDGGVVEFSKEYLPMLSQGAFDDPRLDLVIVDGAAFMKTTVGGFDVIIVDSTDPVGPGEVLFTDTFYSHAKRALAPGGILVTQNGVPFLQGEELTGTMRAFEALFSDATCYLATVPTYSGGPMAFGWGTDGPARDVSLKDLSERVAAAGLRCDYYTPEVHKDAFALPGYVLRLMP